MDVPIHYDPMIAKLVVWGPDRLTAIARCRRALKNYHLVGTSTSIPFFLALFDDPDFLEGRYDTGFISQAWLADKLEPPETAVDLALVATAIARFDRDSRVRSDPSATATSSWKRQQGWKRYGGRS
jgi:acetyl/propionyl-CoA carboxylase alpha subunit